MTPFRVLVTRPEQQADPLCRLIERHGGIAIRWPTLVICEPRDWIPALAIFDQLVKYDLAIFTSANAVHRALPRIQEHGGIPPHLQIAAIGKATAEGLDRHGITTCLQPQQNFTSETLLELLRFQEVAGQSIVIIGGEGGRELLSKTLHNRGAHVVHAAVYRRERPTMDSTMLRTQWQAEGIDAVVITSNESLHNLFEMIGPAGRDTLWNTPLIVVSNRIQSAAKALGCRIIKIAEEASNAAIMEALFPLMKNS